MPLFSTFLDFSWKRTTKPFANGLTAVVGYPCQVSLEESLWYRDMDIPDELRKALSKGVKELRAAHA